MASLISILTVIEPLLTQLSGIVAQAAAASATKDQPKLDSLHAQAVALANSFKPAGD